MVEAAKVQLSESATATLDFAEGDVRIRESIRRDDFERWIADDLARIRAGVPRALERAGVEAAAIDRVFMTGGSSFVPAVRRIFEAQS